MKKCPVCGASMEDMHVFCPGCGVRVEYGTSQHQTPAGEKRITEDDLPDRYKPLSPWAYVGYALLYAIPIVGFVFLIVNSTGASRNINKRNFAISYWCWLAVTAIIIAVVLIICAIAGAGFFGLLSNAL